MQYLPKQFISGRKRDLIVISGYYGFDNLGDEAILEELINELRAFATPEQIYVLSKDPAKTTRLYQVNSLDRWQFFELFPILLQSRLFISGGGGLFQDVSGIGSPIYYGALIALAKLCGSPIFIYAQGLGPLKSVFSQVLTRHTWKLARYITVRDENSLSLAAGWGLNATLSADPVWSLSPSPLPTTVNLPASKKSGIPEFRPLIGISLRESAVLKNNHLKLLPQILKSSFPPATEFVLLPFQKESDLPLLQRLADNCGDLGVRANILNLDELTKASQWLSLIKKLDMLVGMRFHALLMALKGGCPVVGIPYDPKVTYLCQTFGQPMLDYREVDDTISEKLWLKTLRDAFDRRQALAKQAEVLTLSMQEKAYHNLKILTRILKP